MPLIIGVTAGGVLIPVRVDDDGVVSVAPVAGTNEIGKIQARDYGWIGAAWQKNPLLLGYSGDKSQQVFNASATAGTNVLTSSAVPAGEIWIVEAVSARNLNTAPSKLILRATINSVIVALEDRQVIVAGEYATWSGAITLSQNDVITASIVGCTLNDDIYLQFSARRIDIDQ